MALLMNRASFVARFPEPLLVGDGSMVPSPSPTTMTMAPIVPLDDPTAVARKGAPTLPTALICPVRKSRPGEPEPITVGRAPGSDVLIPDESISKAHARFHRTASGLGLVDAGSKNGTWVHEDRLVPEQDPVPV